jgi:hypothetical protein
MRSHILIGLIGVFLVVWGCSDVRPDLVVEDAQSPTPNVSSSGSQLEQSPTTYRTRSASLPAESTPASTPGSRSVPEPVRALKLPTLESTSGSALKSQLPRDVYEQFYGDFYSGCATPSLFSLGVLESWSGSGDDEFRIQALRGTYFLVLVSEPSGADWRFTSVLDHGSGSRDTSLSSTNLAPNHLTDAQQWCSVGIGIPSASRLDIEANDLKWIVYLIST